MPAAVLEFPDGAVGGMLYVRTGEDGALGQSGEGMRSRHARWITRLGLMLLAAACSLAPPAAALWMDEDPATVARKSELVVVGRIDRVKRSIVWLDGALYAKCVGTLEVDEVLMGPDGESVPQEIPVYWGHNRGAGMWIAACCGLHRRGVWFLQRPLGTDDLCLLGPFESIFMPEQEGRALFAEAAEWPAARAYIIVTKDRWILRVWYHNFTDQPREALLWAVRGGELHVPAPYEVTVSTWGGSEEPVTVPVLRGVSADPNTATSVTVAPHSYVDRDCELTELLDLASGMDARTELRMSGRPEVWAELSVYDSGHVDRDLPFPFPFIVGDEGTTLWFLPSEASLFWWLVLGGPVLTACGVHLRRRSKLLRSYLCFGAVLGIAWAWALARWGPDAALRAWRIWEEVPGMSPSYAPAVILGLCLLAPPVAAAVVAVWTRRRRHVPGAWVLWLPWLGLPALAGTVIVLVCGRYTCL